MAKLSALENEETDNPLAQEVRQCWEIDIKNQIRMDLSRTEFFVPELNEKESYDFCFGILYWWSVQKKDLGYRQGMNEIMSVLMKTVFEYESTGRPEANPLGDIQEKQDQKADTHGNENQDNETSGEIAKTGENQELKGDSKIETADKADSQEIKNELEISKTRSAIKANNRKLSSQSTNKSKTKSGSCRSPFIGICQMDHASEDRSPIK